MLSQTTNVSQSPERGSVHTNIVRPDTTWITPKCDGHALMLKAIFNKFGRCHRSPLLWLDTVTKLFDSDLVTQIYLSVERVSSLSEI